MKVEECRAKKCKYLKKHFPQDKHGNWLKGYPVCCCLPFWNKNLDHVRACPRTVYGEDAGKLKVVCKVNDR